MLQVLSKKKLFLNLQKMIIDLQAETRKAEVERKSLCTRLVEALNVQTDYVFHDVTVSANCLGF